MNQVKIYKEIQILSPDLNAFCVEIFQDDSKLLSTFVCMIICAINVNRYLDAPGIGWCLIKRTSGFNPNLAKYKLTNWGGQHDRIW
jgi:hypothetical protein